MYSSHVLTLNATKHVFVCKRHITQYACIYTYTVYSVRKQDNLTCCNYVFHFMKLYIPLPLRIHAGITTRSHELRIHVSAHVITQF